MSEETIREVTKLEAPYGREIVLQDVVHETGLRVMRIRIREGSRFTILDIDAATAKELGTALSTWADQS
ncbi:MAG: hypothetical protein HOB79_16265 [Rhodospirillaceae bacterium]|jgi:hypothetical protein|nr:hypothetical protein [Rhodospirillales bacterium]MBT3905116.1 hypothetical protein [Rhodospirillaceae bacterium]MBT4702625.1 hypothetical protein [Rhodospirillaceae bacterium]MBT5034143.1 hypothetical protein [Rhodospirillaceae bacterium]MBT6220668.1 hypothetical protein [Rhodospirillaceae bacterium]